MSLLDSIHGPSDLKKFNFRELATLADEIRERLIRVVSLNGGHLASNLGVVELTIALHRVFDSNDRIIFDVSHQTYVHKLLTGRNGELFNKIRQTGGYSGFSCPSESKYDCFVAGHAGTALSVALGFAYARKKKHENHEVVAVIGDASLSCGMTMEALNCLMEVDSKILVIVNDNNFSIGKSVGSVTTYVNHILRSNFYKKITTCIKKIIGNGNFGKSVVRKVRSLKRAIKSLLLPTSYFEYYGLRYFGPVDGHNIQQLEEILEFCKNSDRSILLHVKTIKGNGLQEAKDYPEKFHGIEPKRSIDKGQCDSQITYNEILGDELLKIVKSDNRVVCVTAAMASGTGLWRIRDAVPDQYVDVGIAEEHAVTFCAALAKDGMRPICAIYSTFLQRAYDQILHDVCSQNLPVIFFLDRAGVSANDGTTHHGIFDLSYLRHIPNAVVYQPWDAKDFIKIIHSAFLWNKPIFIRYPKRQVELINGVISDGCLEIGTFEKILNGEKICIISFGSMQHVVSELVSKLSDINIFPSVVSAGFIKPLDETMLTSIANEYDLIVTIEDNVLAGGFGSAVLEFYNDNDINCDVMRFGWPDKFIGHATSANELMAAHGLSTDTIFEKIKFRLTKKNSVTNYVRKNMSNIKI